MKICNAENCTYNVFSNGFCIRHQHLRQDEKYLLKKNKPSILMKPKQATSRKLYTIPKVSKKMAKSLKVYHGKRIIHLMENPLCVIKVEGCTRYASEIHHSKGRIGDLLTDERYFKSACGNCHHWAENNPIAAKEKGVSSSRLAKV